MNITRLTELTLFYKIQDVLSVAKTNDQPTTADYKTYNLKYKDIQPQYDFNIYVNGNPYSGNATVNYLNGTIIFPSANASTDTVTASYQYCPVNMYDEGKNPTSNDFNYPAVAVYQVDRTDEAYELGSAEKELHPLWAIEVWTNLGGERNDYTDSIMDMFENQFFIIDYNQGFPLNSDGTKNTSFNSTAQQTAIAFAESINCKNGGSLDVGKVPMYMSVIHAELIVNR